MFFIIVSVLLLLIVGYYAIEVIIGRLKTNDIVNEYINSNLIEITKEDLSETQLQIFIAVQDPNFCNNHGVDLKTPGAGWTTITQSLCKKFYFEDFNQGIRKIKQTLCARFALDPLVDKDTQITLFLNIMYFGNGVYGLNDAAAVYYDKKVNELTEDEFTSLIASLVNPQTLNIIDNPDKNLDRVERIKKVVSGEYTPDGVFDIYYEGAN